MADEEVMEMLKAEQCHALRDTWGGQPIGGNPLLFCEEKRKDHYYGDPSDHKRVRNGNQVIKEDPPPSDGMQQDMGIKMNHICQCEIGKNLTTKGAMVFCLDCGLIRKWRNLVDQHLCSRCGKRKRMQLHIPYAWAAKLKILHCKTGLKSDVASWY